MKLLISGLCGHMGTEVARLALAGCRGADPEATVGVDMNACGAEGMPCATDFATATDPVFTTADCIVDFSHHSATPALLDYAVRYNIPVVLATTGHTEEEKAAIEKAADKAEKLSLIEAQLQDATQIICDIYSRYRFESQVFANREEQFMDADTLSEMMLQAQKQCYGDGLDHNALHPYMWVNKSHYYGPSFYNFPYAFGGLFARGLYAQYEKEGAAFVPKYKKLLYTTTVATAEDTARVAGIDLTDKEFWRGALQTIADQIDLFCQLVEE